MKQKKKLERKSLDFQEMDEHFKPLLDSLLMALESLQQRSTSKVDAKEGEETT